MEAASSVENVLREVREGLSVLARGAELSLEGVRCMIKLRRRPCRIVDRCVNLAMFYGRLCLSLPGTRRS